MRWEHCERCSQYVANATDMSAGMADVKVLRQSRIGALRDPDNLQYPPHQIVLLHEQNKMIVVRINS